MRRASLVAIALFCGALAATAQSPDKELVATISGPTLGGGIVSALAWDKGVLIVQTVAMQKDGTRAPRYFITRGRGMKVEEVKEAPPAAERYWQVKASRVGPAGTGKIAFKTDTKLPMYGVAAQEKRFLDSMDMGGTQAAHEVRLEDLLLHRRTGIAPPYDGEIWSWSPREIGRIAYTDGPGDLWIARTDGRGAERLLKGHFTLPAWSDDGLVIAVAERRNDGAKWDISVVHLPERYRQ